MTGIANVKIFKHSTYDKVINLIETKLPVATSAVMLFHSTPVMNFITWNSFVSAYPRMTDEWIGMVNSHRKEPINKMKECLKKYEARGFVFVDPKEWLGEHVCGSQGYCSKTVRSILDETTMRLDFTSLSNEATEVVDPGLSWKLSSRYDCQGGGKYDPKFGLVRTGAGDRVGE
jgi:hypothetical protein